MVGLPAPASGAPPAGVSARTAPERHLGGAVALEMDPSADSSLSSLNVTGTTLGSMAPVFDPGTHAYQLVSNDDANATVTATPADVGADVVVTLGTDPQPILGAVPLTRGRNDILVTVTSSDSSSTTVYRVTVWRLAAPISRVVALADAHSTILGGTHMTVTLADGQLPDGCSRRYSIGDQSASLDDGSTFDPATGLTKETIEIPAVESAVPGKADLLLKNTCSLPAGGAPVSAITTTHDAVTYTAGYPVERADVPATVSSGTAIVLHGTDVNGGARAAYWIVDAQGKGERLSTWNWTGNDNAVVYVRYPYEDPWYLGSGPRTLHVGYCLEGGKSGGESDFSTCVTTFTQQINWVQPVVNNVSFTPSSGPVAGGTTVRLRGRYLLSGLENDLTVKVGGVPVDFTEITKASNSNSFEDRTQGLDVIDIVMPPAAAPGPVQISVTSEMGTAVARGTFTYGARPAISSIMPASVAYSGGSVITVLGTNFGTAGRPTVIIGGVKSPLVTRISATKLTAVVPVPSPPGLVNVTVSSPQGGGVSLAAPLNLTAPTTLPTVTAFSAASGRVGDEITLTGTGFGAAGTVGVSVGGQWALVTASSATSVTFEVPSTATTGLKDVVVGATTGTVTKVEAFAVLPEAGITLVTPGTVPSYATGAGAQIALDGAGFGTIGILKVGSAPEQAYTATAGGTHIAGVVVPTSVAGVLPIVVTPNGMAPLRSSVRVTGPVITYVGSDPRNDRYAPGNIDLGTSGFVLDVPTAGGTPMRIEGSGFGSAGVLSMGGDTLVTTSWTDTAVTFTVPAHAAGPLPFTLTPAQSSLSATQATGVNYVAPIVGLPSMERIASVDDLSRPDRNEFDPANDPSDLFTITGTNLAGTDPSATRVVVSDDPDAENPQTFTVVPTVSTASSLTFAAPRGFAVRGWKTVKVTTDLGTDLLTLGMYYLPQDAVNITVSPASGLCLRTSTPASGLVQYEPAVVTIHSDENVFGDPGTVSIDGDLFTPTSYAADDIVVSMADLATDLENPWGVKSIVITPDGGPARFVSFTCGVTPTVTTTVNGSTAPLTVPVGTSYALGNTTTGFIGATPFLATDPDGYEYVTASNFDDSGFDYNVKAGAPVGAGDFYVRVAQSRATYAAERYLPFTVAPVHITITGTPVTITPTVNGGTTFVYRGALGDGTAGSPSDFGYTANAADPVTKVTWEYRDSACESSGWTSGLPKDVAIPAIDCGGNDYNVSSWEVRVASFEMTTGGTDRSIYYQGTFPSISITINPRDLTVAGARADRVYDGTTAAVIGDLSLTGAIEGDDITLDNGSSAGTFAGAGPGLNKPVLLSEDLVLAGSAKGNYTLTNPRPTIAGTITRASAVLGLAASKSSVLLSAGTPVSITTTLTDARTGVVVADGANAAPVVLISQTPQICTISGTVVTAIGVGACVITGTEATSANYWAATAASDENSTTETVTFYVLGAPQTISVVADDLTIAVGDSIDPTSQISGLFDGDSVAGVAYQYLSGGLPVVPTEPGSYTIVPSGGSLNGDADSAQYTNPTAFNYVPGTLVITPLPPVITAVAPPTGDIAGGTSVTITGSRLDTVRSVRIGDVTLRAGDFTVNEDGTSLTFTTPPRADPGSVELVLIAGTASAADAYTYTTDVVPEPTPTPTEPEPIPTEPEPTPTLPQPTPTPIVPTPTPTVPEPTPTPTDSGPSATVPSAPTYVAIIRGDLSMVVTFGPPTDDGGAAVTAYEISFDAGETWYPAASRPGFGGTRILGVARLQNGFAYRVEIRALNSVGAGPGSSAILVVLNAPELPVVSHPATQIRVPARPNSYRGPKKYTRALGTSHSGLDAHTIPALGARQLTRGDAATLSKAGLFKFDSAVLTALGRAEVRILARHLNLANAVVCEGYTDYAGEDGHEMKLSLQRAKAVCGALVQYGATVVTTSRGYGGARPAVVGGSAQSREANRRVVVVVAR